MFDVLRAVSGKKRCDWCVDRPTTWWERLTDQDKYGESPVWWKRTVVNAQMWFSVKIPVWALGAKWHYRFHIPDDDYRKVKDRWCDLRKEGDVVCDCQGKHQKIVEFLDKDTVVLEDGYQCSLYHCCSEPDSNNECHHGIPIEEFWDRKDDD